MTKPGTGAISPFFIVSKVEQTIAFYRERLGFEARFQQPEQHPFFAILGRDGAQIFVKSDKDTPPLPNPKRHSSMKWDAYIDVPDPDALAAEFAGRFAGVGSAFRTPLGNTSDGLRGFEISDPDGYVLFFGRPRDPGHTANGVLAEVPTKAKLVAAEPQLFASDLGAACEFYKKKLGFTIAFVYGEPPFYAQVFRDGARLNIRHLDEAERDAGRRDGEHLLSATITVEDAERLFVEFQTAGVVFHQRLRTEEWGARTFMVRDPGGNLILFAGAAAV